MDKLIWAVLIWPLVALKADLLLKMKDTPDLGEMYRIVKEQEGLAKAYLEEDNYRMTLFAPVDDVFNRYPDLRSYRLREVLGHIADIDIPQIGGDKRWPLSNDSRNNALGSYPSSLGTTIIKRNINGGNIYVRQMEHNANNFSYFANNGRLCNHVSTSWFLVSGMQYLYKICSWFGHTPYQRDALAFIKADRSEFVEMRYNNFDLRRLQARTLLYPSVSTLVFGNSAWNAYHTFFLPNDHAFDTVPNQNDIHQEVLLAHVTMPGMVYFTESWLYDFGIHWYPTVRLDSNYVVMNDKLKLSIRNITERDTGRWSVYAVSQVFQKYSTFRRGAVWAKIVTPNIPVSNGVVHVINGVLGVVTQTIEQILDNDADRRFTQLMLHAREIGQIILTYLSAHSGSITFFAPTNEAWRRIPRDMEQRLLRDRIWMASILRMHIIQGELTSEDITNHTIQNTEERERQLYFLKGEWPTNNITYYVVGGGVRATIRQDSIAATNGIVHFIDRVLGVPYHTMFEIMRNTSVLQHTYEGIKHTPLRNTLDPPEVVRPEQNFTFFIPTDEAWFRGGLQQNVRRAFFNGAHWDAFQYVMKRHLIIGSALSTREFRERSFLMMNNQRVVMRRRGRFWQLFWPYGSIIANVEVGGEIAARNGYMHKINNVLALQEDLDAWAPEQLRPSFLGVVLGLLLAAGWGGVR